MNSFAETIALLTNPKPKVLDPEDDLSADAPSTIYKKSDENDTRCEVSELRSKTAPLLEDLDPKYAGRKVSRKSLGKTFCEPEELHEESFKTFEDSSDEESNEEINAFKDIMNSQSKLSDDEEDYNDDSFQEDKNEDSEKESLDDESSEENETSVKGEDRFSTIDNENEIEKGKAIKTQQELWDRLCESRIKLQKLLILANKLPQYNLWPNLKNQGSKELSDNVKKGCSSVKNLLNTWLSLQAELFDHNPEINKSEKSEAKCKIDNQSDEEIPSDSNEEISSHSDEEIPSDNDKEIKNSANITSEKKTVKRKGKNKDFGEILAKRHKSLIPYRNSVVQKWDEKTRLSTGRMTQKSFAAFDNSALKQIEQIMQDKNRLIKRTQLKRSLYRVLGKPEIVTDEENQSNISKQDMLLKDYDPEIFDDDDFYRQLLKDVIESKSIGIDPSVLRKQMEIQKIRNKMKRKIDTKASKGRKLRYDVHAKLLNFMAPLQTSTMSEEARDNLLKCLFARSSKQST